MGTSGDCQYAQCLNSLAPPCLSSGLTLLTAGEQWADEKISSRNE